MMLVLVGMGVSAELAATADLRRLDHPERPVTTGQALTPSATAAPQHVRATSI